MDVIQKAGFSFSKDELVAIKSAALNGLTAEEAADELRAISMNTACISGPCIEA